MIRIDGEDVAGRTCEDDAGPEDPAQRRDRVLQRRGRGFGRLPAPDRIDERFRRNDLAGAEDQDCQDGSLLRPAERDECAIVVAHLERPQDSELGYVLVVTQTEADCEHGGRSVSGP